MSDTEFIVVGQGLAGTAITWTLLERGASVRIIDDTDGESASRIAAGLLTPLAGRRLGPVDGYDTCFAAAAPHYRAIEEFTDAQFFRAGPALRLFHTQEEVDHYAQRRAQLGATARPLTTPVPPGLDPGLGGIELPGAARLDVARYLDASRAAFIERGIWHRGRVKPATLGRTSAGIETNCEGLTAQRLIFCGGFSDVRNPWLPTMSFAPAKGELLAVRLPGLTEQRTVHSAHGWLIPTTEPQIYRFGATYDHADLAPGVTEAGRERLLERLASLVSVPVEVVDQYAAIRPIGALREPIIGRHPQEKRIAFLNGLGSRGALWAPFLAHALCAFLLDETPLSLPMRPPPVPAPAAR